MWRGYGSRKWIIFRPNSLWLVEPSSPLLWSFLVKSSTCINDFHIVYGLRALLRGNGKRGKIVSSRLGWKLRREGWNKKCNISLFRGAFDVLKYFVCGMDGNFISSRRRSFPCFGKSQKMNKRSEVFRRCCCGFNDFSYFMTHKNFISFIVYWFYFSKISFCCVFRCGKFPLLHTQLC